MPDTVNLREFIAAFDDGDRGTPGNLEIEVHADAWADGAGSESRTIAFIDNSDGSERRTFSIKLDDVESFIGAVRKAAEVAKAAKSS